MSEFHYKSLKSWKTDNIDLTQQFSLSILTDFRYQSLKITWLLAIAIVFIDTDFFPLTTLGTPEVSNWCHFSPQIFKLRELQCLVKAYKTS